jgi:hypothetical protein
LLPACCFSGSCPRSLESYRKMKRLNDYDRKQAIQEINKTIHQIVPKY